MYGLFDLLISGRILTTICSNSFRFTEQPLSLQLLWRVSISVAGSLLKARLESKVNMVLYCLALNMDTSIFLSFCSILTRLHSLIVSSPFWVLSNSRLGIFIPSVEKLAPEIGKLKNLTTLELGGEKISSLPEEIKKLTNLEILRISGKFSETEKQKIAKWLPNCKITWDWGWGSGYYYPYQTK